MAHARQQIREAIVTLVTGLATTGGNVFDTRVYLIDGASLPSLTVMIGNEEYQGEESETIGARQKFQIPVSIVARAKPADGAATVEDQLDQICAEVQAAMFTDYTIGGRVENLVLRGTEFSFVGTLERPVGEAEMSFEATYMILASDPETILNV